MEQAKQPTTENPITVKSGYEVYTAPDGTRFARNLEAHNEDSTWLYSVSKGRYTFKVRKNKKTIGIWDKEKAAAGFGTEQEIESVYIELEQWNSDPKKKRRMFITVMDLRELQHVFDGLDIVRSVFNSDNPRRDAQ